MTTPMTLSLASAQATEELGAGLAHILALAHRVRGNACIIYLRGDLGAGKTTLARGFLRGLGYVGRVKSPTYTLVETYRVEDARVFHFDLYRLVDPEELDYIGFRDYVDDRSILLIEWPEHGLGVLPQDDLRIEMTFAGDSIADEARSCQLTAHSVLGEGILVRLRAKRPAKG
jgi:tRNA threonylcarbamoyladenosine biosynthesis protein TsaE